MTYVVPGATFKPVANRSAGIRQPTLGLVLHVQAGNNSPFGWFCNPKAQASSTWWVGKDGTLEQYVDPDTEHAWAQAAGNRDYHSVETEGYPGEPLTGAQISTLARLYWAGHQRWGWPLQLAEQPGQAGLGWHGMGAAAWGGHTGCPGDVRKAQRAAILSSLAGHPGGSSAPAVKPAPAPAPAPKPVVKPPSTPPYPGLLRQGSTGAAVRTLQARLAQRGWRITVDGNFGPATRAVVVAFQADKHLTQDGLVGPATWAALWSSPITR